MAETNIGVQLEATLRSGAIGTWWTASTGGGHPFGMLQLEPLLVAEAEVRVAHGDDGGRDAVANLGLGHQ